LIPWLPHSRRAAALAAALLRMAPLNGADTADSGATSNAEIERGRKIYNYRCYFCHGYSGDGRTVAAVALNPRPRNFQATATTALPRSRIVAAVTHGVPGTAMASFEKVLSPSEINAVAHFIESEFLIRHAHNTYYHTAENGWPDHAKYYRAFPFVNGDISLSRSMDHLNAEQRAGRQLYITHCVTCHNPGTGAGEEGTWRKADR
jgi:cytochrome c oxidase cbb3-type subunit III